MRKSLIFLVIFCSCSSINKQDELSVGLYHPSENQRAATVVPYNMEVLEELNDGQTLFIRANISKEEKPENIPGVVRLTGFKDGKIINEKILNIKDLPAGERSEFVIDIPSADLSDYQLDLLWGENAKDYLPQEEAPSPDIPELDTVTVEKVQQCKQEDCRITFNLKGRIRNSGKSTIRNITLGLSFLTDEQIQSGPISPKGEKEILLEKTDIPPTGFHVFNLEAAPPLSGPDLKPYLRIKTQQP